MKKTYYISQIARSGGGKGYEEIRYEKIEGLANARRRAKDLFSAYLNMCEEEMYARNSHHLSCIYCENSHKTTLRQSDKKIKEYYVELIKYDGYETLESCYVTLLKM